MFFLVFVSQSARVFTHLGFKIPYIRAELQLLEFSTNIFNFPTNFFIHYFRQSRNFLLSGNTALLVPWQVHAQVGVLFSMPSMV